ncbi:MAG: addiction module antidote protein, HigA family [Anaerolinea sp.]|nr:addiction module antidote protein, HigA family [Anaerolinea sp.]
MRLNRIPSHLGETLRREFLEPMRLTQSAFASHIGVPLQRVNVTILGKRGISLETAWLFAQAFWRHR